LSQILDRAVQAVARSAVPFASQVLDRGAEAVTRGAARCASRVLDRGAQTGDWTSRHTHLIVVLRSVLRPLPAATLRRRTGEKHSADEQRNRVNITSSRCTEAM